MASNDLLGVIAKYKLKLENEDDYSTVLHLLKKVERIKMSLEILKATGIGKTVNKLTKLNGDVGEISNRIVNEWKMIAARKEANNNNVPSCSKVKEEKESKKSVKRKLEDEETSTTSKKKSKVATNGDANNCMSFEDCLGMSDVSKRKKKSSSVPSGSRDASSNGNGHSPFLDPKQEERHYKREGHKSEKVKHETISSAPSSSLSLHTTQSKITNLLEKDLDFPLPKITLPEIQADYKPLRSHYIIDDTSNQRKKQVEHDNNYFPSSRHTRTQVFSGRKSNYVMEIPSLKDACIRVLQDNLDDFVQDQGTYIHYDILKPVIERLNVHQLFELEKNNKHLQVETAKLWEKHCEKDFRGCKRKKKESCKDLYWRLVREREDKLKDLTANISRSMIAKSAPVRQTKLAYVDCTVKPPRSVARQQAKFGTSSGNKSEDKYITKKAKLINSITSNVTNSTCEMVSLPPPSASSSHFSQSSSSSGASTSQQPQKVVKKVAPLMQKTLKLLKNRFRR